MRKIIIFISLFVLTFALSSCKMNSITKENAEKLFSIGVETSNFILNNGEKENTANLVLVVTSRENYTYKDAKLKIEVSYQVSTGAKRYTYTLFLNEKGSGAITNEKISIGYEKSLSKEKLQIKILEASGTY